MQKLLNTFDRIIATILMVAVMLYICFQTVELCWESVRTYTERFRQSGLSYTTAYGKDLFVIFFNILLAIEILETVRVFNKDHQIKLKIILLVCIVAVSRKILTLDPNHSEPIAELALAALVLALSGGYYLVNKISATTLNK